MVPLIYIALHWFGVLPRSEYRHKYSSRQRFQNEWLVLKKIPLGFNRALTTVLQFCFTFVISIYSRVCLFLEKREVKNLKYNKKL